MIRLVLDTHVWLDWLVFDDPGVRALRDAVAAGLAEIVIDAACDAELERVLAYDFGKRSIAQAAQLAALAEARRLARRVDIVVVEKLPQCRDPDDQKFVELAYAAKADALLTKDRALLQMRKRVPFRIVRPEEMGSEGLTSPAGP
jgi:putative PIN family toxin of toxin-antitoxin system